MNDKVLEDLARLFCERDEFDPDARIGTTDLNGQPTSYPRWKEYLDVARQAYRIAHRVPVR